MAAVLLAGCSGGIDSASSPEPPDTAWAEGESLDTAALAERHYETLRDAGSFTMNHSETVGVDGDPRPDGPKPDGYHPPSVVRHRVDLEDGRYLGRYVTVGSRRSTHFVTPEVTATRRKPCPTGCDYEYRYSPRPEGDTLSEHVDRFRTEEAVVDLARFLRGVTVGFNYSYAGTVERDGETLYRYRARRNLSTAPPPFAEPPRGTATILASNEGVIRRFELQYTGPATVTDDGEDRTVRVTHTFVRTYTDIGETTIERPAWVDRAADDPPRTTATGDS